MGRTAQHARNLVVMLAAGGVLGRLVIQARQFGVTATDVAALSVPAEEVGVQQLLVEALSRA